MVRHSPWPKENVSAAGDFSLAKGETPIKNAAVLLGIDKTVAFISQNNAFSAFYRKGLLPWLELAI